MVNVVRPQARSVLARAGEVQWEGTGHMLLKGLLEEYFSIKIRKTWEYTFKKKPGSDWKAMDSSRIARTSAVAHGNHLLLTIGAQRV
jgi:hypothetical protein